MLLRWHPHVKMVMEVDCRNLSESEDQFLAKDQLLDSLKSITYLHTIDRNLGRDNLT